MSDFTFDLSLVLDWTLAQQKVQQKSKSKSEVSQCIAHVTYKSENKDGDDVDAGPGNWDHKSSVVMKQWMIV